MPRTRSDTQPILTSAELDLLKRLQSLRTLELPVPVAAEALIQAHRYRAATASADWASLAEAAARDRDSVGMVFNRLAAAQKKVSKVASAAEEIEVRADAQEYALNKVHGWRAVVGAARADLRSRGIPDSFARRSITALGHTRISVPELKKAAHDAARTKATGSNQAHALALRQEAGAMLASVSAQLNGAPTAGSRARDDAGDLAKSERDLYDAVKAGTDVAAAAERLRAAGEHVLPARVDQLAAAAPGTEAALRATIAVQAALDAAVIGRFGRWHATWPLASLSRLPVASLPFDGAAPEEAALHSGRRVHQLLSGVVESVGYDRGRSIIVVCPARGAARTCIVPYTDVSALGLAVGCWAAVTAADVLAAGELRPRFVPLGAAPASWREAVRRSVRESFLAVPFGLGLAWSWQAGADGVARMVASCAWFS